MRSNGHSLEKINRMPKSEASWASASGKFSVPTRCDSCKLSSRRAVQQQTTKPTTRLTRRTSTTANASQPSTDQQARCNDSCSEITMSNLTLFYAPQPDDENCEASAAYEYARRASDQLLSAGNYDGQVFIHRLSLELAYTIYLHQLP